MHKLRFRQIHLDFHTSPNIDGIGEYFDKKQWQETLQKAHINSITCFSSCHHGMSYHPTKVGKMHPGLKFNLLRQQIDACHEIDVKVPVYLTGGINDYVAETYPGWRGIEHDGRLSAPPPLIPGFKRLCFNSPYLDYICDYLTEMLGMFPDADGVFIDIISAPSCYCKYCLNDMHAAGIDPHNPEEVQKFAQTVLMKYYQRTSETVRRINPNMPLFHNSGHVHLMPQDILPYFSHLELESLPTGGWGYDHYPMSAAYSRNLNKDFLGMTGKFHGTWGEFGGFKHPNALRYECAAMLANGSKCSIGDQLHPNGKLDESTYEIISQAYADVESKEPWCEDSVSSCSSAILQRTDRSFGTTGASRFLLETHIPFDIVDEQMDFNAYKVLILAEEFPLNSACADKLQQFVQQGGKLIMCGSAPMVDGVNRFDLGGTLSGESPFAPDFVQVAPEFVSFAKTPFLMRLPSYRFKADDPAKSIGKVFDPCFNRTIEHYCSHQHAPYRNEESGFDAGIITDNILYFAHPVFSLYCSTGMVELKMFMEKVFRKFYGNGMDVIVTNMPSTGRVALRKQNNRYILHALYATPSLRGSNYVPIPGDQRPSTTVEIIEELMPLYNTTYSVALPSKPNSVTIQPEGKSLDFTWKDGRLEFSIDCFTCHAMVVIE